MRSPSLSPLLLAGLFLGAAAGSLFADGIQLPVLLGNGELAVADMQASGIGSGSVHARTGGGVLRVEAGSLRTLPDGYFLTSGKGQPVLLQLMGGQLIDVHDFETRLVAAVQGAPVPEAREVRLFNPAGALAAAGTRTKAAAPRKTRARAKPGRTEAVEPSQPAGRSFHVLATAEGLIGGRTATGTIIGKWMKGAALPSRKGLRRKVAVVYDRNQRRSTAEVLDVGPWNISDPYWETRGGRPQAETGRDRSGRRTNKAGIDLFNATWYDLLGLRSYDKRLIENTSGWVTWNFVE